MPKTPSFCQVLPVISPNGPTQPAAPGGSLPAKKIAAQGCG
jgi:hypothetical protein